MKRIQYAALVIFLSCSSVILATNDANFYHARFFPRMPRFDKDLLTTYRAHIAGGSTQTGFNHCGETVSAFDIHGPHDIMLDTKNGSGLHAVSFHGRFEFFEFRFSFIQNFCNGFFMEVYNPLRKISACDIYPEILDIPQQISGDINVTQQIFDHYSFEKIGFSRANFGDATFLFGWTDTYEESNIFDFIDVTLQSGVLAPTSRPKRPDILFDIPSGYNGHTSIPLHCAAAIGLYDWITYGMSADVLFFFDQTRPVRMKNDPHAAGVVATDIGIARIARDPLWHIGWYFEADHVIRGLSLALGHSYDRQEKTTLYPKNRNTFPYAVANRSADLCPWSMHTFHISIAYDFATQKCPTAPVFTVFYNRVLHGKNIFNNSIGSGAFSLNIEWFF
jgi:hypothetical protein